MRNISEVSPGSVWCCKQLDLLLIVLGNARKKCHVKIRSQTKSGLYESDAIWPKKHIRRYYKRIKLRTVTKEK